jgi:hypothetical protein
MPNIDMELTTQIVLEFLDGHQQFVNSVIGSLKISSYLDRLTEILSGSEPIEMYL